MSRTILKTICIVSGILFVLFFVLTLLSVTAELEQINTSGGIIGGADAPTVEFLLQNSSVYYFAIPALLMLVITGVSLIFGKKLKK